MAVAALSTRAQRAGRNAAATAWSRARGRPKSQPPPVTQASLEVWKLLHGAASRARRGKRNVPRARRVVERVRLELLALDDLRTAIDDAETTHCASSDVLDGARRDPDALLGRVATRRTSLCASIGSALSERATPRWSRSDDGRGNSERDLLLIAAARAMGSPASCAALRNGDFAGSRGELRAELAEARLPAALRPRQRAGGACARISGCRRSRSAMHCVAACASRWRSWASARWPIPHGYWIPMTIAIVLKPDFAGTFRFGLLRVIGTFAGLLLTTLARELRVRQRGANAAAAGGALRRLSPAGPRCTTASA